MAGLALLDLSVGMLERVDVRLELELLQLELVKRRARPEKNARKARRSTCPDRAGGRGHDDESTDVVVDLG